MKMMRGRVCFICLLLLMACNQHEKDKGIRQMINAQAREKIAFAGVEYSVQNGVVILRGTCSTEQERSEVESEVKQTSGVKEVQNQIIIAPVILTGEHLIKKAVDSVLADYPAVQASIRDSVVYLNGETDKQTSEKLLQALTTMKVKTINQLSVSPK